MLSVQADVAPYGISDLRVTRVTRIHNRFLRNRFEERLEQLVDTSDPSYKVRQPYRGASLKRNSPPPPRATIGP